MRRAMLLAVSVLFLLVGAALVRADVTLSYFEAVRDDGQITLVWETATEDETAGYYIWRSTVPEFSGSTRVSPYIPAEGESGQGAFYSFEDTTVANGTVYYYRLEEIMTDNMPNIVEVVSATAGLDVPTPTVTPVSTGTPRLTLTPTPSRTPSPTPSASRQPTAVPLSPGMVTLTPTSAASRPATASPTATSQAVIPASPVAATSQATSASTGLPAATSTARPTARSSLQPSRVPTLTDQRGPTPVARGLPGEASSGTITLIPGGTNWLVSGLVMGMFAAALFLVAGAIYLLRWLR